MSKEAKVKIDVVRLVDVFVSEMDQQWLYLRHDSLAQQGRIRAFVAVLKELALCVAPQLHGRDVMKFEITNALHALDPEAEVRAYRERGGSALDMLRREVREAEEKMADAQRTQAVALERIRAELRKAEAEAGR